MTLSELGSLGELIGAVATVATLLYLALQIRANTLATKRQSLDDTIERVIRWGARLVESPEQASAWIHGTRCFHDLSLEDQIRFTTLLTEFLAGVEATLEAAKFGDVKPESVDAARGIVASLFRNQGVRECWDSNGRQIFAQDLVAEVDRIYATLSDATDGPSGPLPFHISEADRE